MVKGIRSAVAALVLTCLFGVQVADAKVTSTKLTSLDILNTSCTTDPQAFLYALRFGQKLGDTTSTKDQRSDVSAVFASSKGKDTNFKTEITAKEVDSLNTLSDSNPVIESSVPSVTPAMVVDAANVTPTPTQAAQVNSGGGLDAEVLFAMANSYRASLGLPAFEKEPRVCQIAVERAPQLQNEVMSGTMHAGLYNRHDPFWVTENMIYMRNNEEAFNWWLHSPVHRGQLQGNFKYACAACVGNACTLVFTNFVSK